MKRRSPEIVLLSAFAFLSLMVCTGLREATGQNVPFKPQTKKGSSNQNIQLDLTVTPHAISYSTPWPGFTSSFATANMTIKTTPPGGENDVSLEIKDVTPVAPATTGIGNGTLTKISSNTWRYDSCTEPQTNKNPPWLVYVNIHAKRNGVTLATCKIKVFNVFRYFSGEALHRNRDTAWQYAKWKYDIKTVNLSAIMYVESLTEPGDTNVLTKTCRLGPYAYMDVEKKDENACASTLGHENVHGGQTLLESVTAGNQFFVYRAYGGYPSSTHGGPEFTEVAAYDWEISNAAGTGISSNWLNEAAAWRNYYNCTGPKPW